MLVRPRRNRKNAVMRGLVQENHLQLQDLIAPFFVLEGINQKEPIVKVPGIFRYSIDLLLKKIGQIHAQGIHSVAIFPAIPIEQKGADASEALNPNGLIPRAVRAIKQEFPSICVITDVALDPYTDHGHDGLASEHGEILNDLTINMLVQQAIVQAEAGVDIVAPSDMMDGRVKAIREGLDSRGFENTSILSYTAKYASALYGPYRDAINTELAFGDKLTYQLSPANVREALHEAKLDIEEGADMLMVKPATFYLDVVTKIKEHSHIPVGAYHVTGEYSMVIAAANQGMIDKHKVLHEALLSIKRAGASFIFTYAYDEMIEVLR